MGALGGPLGLNGGAAGSGFAAPEGTNIVNPTSAEQIAQANAGTNTNMGNQAALLAALQGQGGLQNQASIFNQQQGLANQLQQANGVGNLSTAAQGYQNIANGTGPNLAQTMLNQTTAQNVANQSALMAGQRGASANVGLMARQAAMQGANTQQQAAGQAAILEAQQQQNALAGLGNIGNQQLAAQQAQQGQLAGLANSQVKNQIGQANANTAAAQAQQANLMNAQAAANSANVGMQSNINQGNTALATQEMQQGESAVGGMMNGMGSMMSSSGGGAAMAAAQGGMVPSYADGGMTEGPQSEFGQFLSSVSGGGGMSLGSYAIPNSVMQSGSSKPPSQSQPQNSQQQAMMTQPNKKDTGMGATDTGANYSGSLMASRGGKVDVIVSPGEKIVSPEKAQNVAKGGKLEARTVPGKAEVKGDSLKNDKVHAKLEPGTVVVKRTRADNDPEGFVRAVLAKRGRK